MRDQLGWKFGMNGVHMTITMPQGPTLTKEAFFKRGIGINPVTSPQWQTDDHQTFNLFKITNLICQQHCGRSRALQSSLAGLPSWLSGTGSINNLHLYTFVAAFLFLSACAVCTFFPFYNKIILYTKFQDCQI